jgi:hypothetical protein
MSLEEIINKQLTLGGLVQGLHLCQCQKLTHFGLLLAKIVSSQNIVSGPIFQEVYSKLYKDYVELSKTSGEEKIEEEEEEDGIEEPVDIREELEKQNPVKYVKLLCNWTTSEYLCKLWNKMSQNGDYKWNDIQITWKDEPEPDYYVIINKPPENALYKPEKTIIFQMEPNMAQREDLWGKEWVQSDKNKFLEVVNHESAPNNIEWHLSKTHKQLKEEKIEKKFDKELSTILSDKYQDPGQKLRIDFVRFLEEKEDIKIHRYGADGITHRLAYKNYRGALPYHTKDRGLFPYQYTFNAENHSIPNYCTEKLIDAILSECLCFYWGPDNISELIDERAYVRLELKDFEHDYNVIKDAIENNLWVERLPYISKEKFRILNELQFFPRLESIINKHIRSERED